MNLVCDMMHMNAYYSYLTHRNPPPHPPKQIYIYISSLHTPLHPQVKWQATLRTLDGTQTLKASWLLKWDIHIAGDVDLVLLGGNLDKSDLAKDQVGGGIALKTWPDLKRARRTSYFLLFICFVSCETLR